MTTRMRLLGGAAVLALLGGAADAASAARDGRLPTGSEPRDSDQRTNQGSVAPARL